MTCRTGKLLLLLSVLLYMSPELCEAQGEFAADWFAKHMGGSGSQEEVLEMGDEELSKFVRRGAD